MLLKLLVHISSYSCLLLNKYPSSGIIPYQKVPNLTGREMRSLSKQTLLQPPLYEAIPTTYSDKLQYIPFHYTSSNLGPSFQRKRFVVDRVWDSPSAPSIHLSFDASLKFRTNRVKCRHGKRGNPHDREFPQARSSAEDQGCDDARQTSR